jgi:FAD/FMN-containing dehydrogenase
MFKGLNSRPAEVLAALFAAHQPRVVAEPLSDFACLQTSASPFCEVAPRSVDEAAEVVRIAVHCHVPLRVRGAGHALNGSSLPRAGEVTLRTRNLAWVRYDEEDTVTAGAGMGLWSLRDLLNAKGFTLPVVNDGYEGPTIGGYISGGGFGPGSQRYGGFWENVAEVTLLTPAGVQRVARHDALFPWLVWGRVPWGGVGAVGRWPAEATATSLA